MKKSLFVILACVLLLPSLEVNAVVTNSSQYADLKVYLFGEENCELCAEEKEWLQEYSNKENTVSFEYFDKTEKEELFKTIKDKLFSKEDDLPITIIGSNYFVGFNDQVKDKIKEAATAYNEADSYCDIVARARNNGDMEECLETNKEIYHSDESLPLWTTVGIVLILTIVVIGLIVSAVVMIKKKKEN